MLGVDFYRLYNDLWVWDLMPCLCCLFAVIIAIFTKVCRVFYHFLPWFSTVPPYVRRQFCYPMIRATTATVIVTQTTVVRRLTDIDCMAVLHLTLLQKQVSPAVVPWSPVQVSCWPLSTSHDRRAGHNKRRLTYTVAQKIGIIFLYALTLPHVDRFSQSFHCQNPEKICNNILSVKILPHLKSVATTLPCETSVS